MLVLKKCLVNDVATYDLLREFPVFAILAFLVPAVKVEISIASKTALNSTNVREENQRNVAQLRGKSLPRNRMHQRESKRSSELF